MPDVHRIHLQLDDYARRIESLTETWAINADVERRFHYRSDEKAIDEMLELIVLNSILFGDRREDESSEPTS